MKTRICRLLLLCWPLGFVVVANVLAYGGDCPNWSPKFDRITNPEARAKLAEMKDWDKAIDESGGPTKMMFVLKNDLKSAKDHKAKADQAVKQVAADPSAAKSPVTWQDCKGQGNALTAAKCESLNMSELILSLEGSIDLVQCRLDKAK